MYKQLLFILAVLLSCTLFACRQQRDVDEKVNYIADLECRAVVLRESRFALANQIRFAQDTLLKTKRAEDTLRLVQQIQTFTHEKDTLLQHSLQLADTIHLQLDSLRKFIFSDNNDRKQFEQKLNEALQRRGCIKK